MPKSSCKHTSTLVTFSSCDGMQGPRQSATGWSATWIRCSRGIFVCVCGQWLDAFHGSDWSVGEAFIADNRLDESAAIKFRSAIDLAVQVQFMPYLVLQSRNTARSISEDLQLAVMDRGNLADARR
eukprot:6460291-Amphidinium_carterae.1